MPFSKDLFYEISNVLIEEAEMLDHSKFEEWYEFLADDISYKMPIRLNMPRDEEDYSKGQHHFLEDKNTLRYRVQRYNTGFAWAEDPPSRTRRFISNIKILSVDEEKEEVEVKSYFMLYRNRGIIPDTEILTGERFDILRKEKGAWKLSKRFVLIDQATLKSKNMALFV